MIIFYLFNRPLLKKSDIFTMNFYLRYELLNIFLVFLWLLHPTCVLGSLWILHPPRVGLPVDFTSSFCWLTAVFASYYSVGLPVKFFVQPSCVLGSLCFVLSVLSRNRNVSVVDLCLIHMRLHYCCPAVICSLLTLD